MDTKKPIDKANLLLIIGGIVLVIILGLGVRQSNTNGNKVVASPTIAGQSATLTPVGSSSASITILPTKTIIPSYSMKSASQSAQQPHPIK